MTIAQQIAHDFLARKELEDYCIERICPICNFKKQTPCIVNKICNEEAVTGSL